ncbi:uncharacterized protein LOC131399766, partial [Diceros bicornis minor]|uniref:uncharacterized protein LOC131399766 n=1 Tax=Diceros bicornis minor TaxID=77932 RepID=UPI0026EB750B
MASPPPGKPPGASGVARPRTRDPNLPAPQNALSAAAAPLRGVPGSGALTWLRGGSRRLPGRAPEPPASGRDREELRSGWLGSALAERGRALMAAPQTNCRSARSRQGNSGARPCARSRNARPLRSWPARSGTVSATHREAPETDTRLTPPLAVTKDRTHRPPLVTMPWTGGFTFSLVLLLLCACPWLPLGEGHTLCYEFTISPKPKPGQPWCILQGKVNGDMFLHYHCGGEKFEPEGRLGMKVNTTEAWGRQSEALKELVEELRKKLLEVEREISTTSDPLTLQGRMTCPCKANGGSSRCWHFDVCDSEN